MDEQKQTPEPDAAAAAAPSGWLARLAGLKRFLTRKWIATAVVASVLVHLAMYLSGGQARREARSDEGLEVSLGQFRFIADASESSRIARADSSSSRLIVTIVSPMTASRTRARITTGRTTPDRSASRLRASAARDLMGRPPPSHRSLEAAASLTGIRKTQQIVRRLGGVGLGYTSELD